MLRWVGAAALVLAFGGGATAAPPHRMDAGQIARGEYLANHVANCGDCHTPRDPQGRAIRGRALKGAKLDFASLHPMPWAAWAPSIAGTGRGHSQAEVATLLQTGRWPNGSSPRPPMPTFGLTKTDAEAVAAYLASLPR